MDDKTIYSIIIAVVIIIITIILYFLFVKKTISAVPVTSSTFSSPTVTQTSSSTTSSSISTSTQTTSLKLVVYNYCNNTMLIQAFGPLGNRIGTHDVSWYSSAVFDYVPNMYLVISAMGIKNSNVVYSYVDTVYPKLGEDTVINKCLVVRCCSTSVPSSIPGPNFTIYNNCSSPVNATIYYPSLFPTITNTLYYQSSVTTAYMQGTYVVFTSQSGENLGTVYPAVWQTVTPPQCPS